MSVKKDKCTTVACVMMHFLIAACVMMHFLIASLMCWPSACEQAGYMLALHDQKVKAKTVKNLSDTSQKVI